VDISDQDREPRRVFIIGCIFMNGIDPISQVNPQLRDRHQTGAHVAGETRQAVEQDVVAISNRGFRGSVAPHFGAGFNGHFFLRKVALESMRQ
jgi:hypothetical protein